jgi:ABC-type uncharacterized transport system permease subunit
MWIALTLAALLLYSAALAGPRLQRIVGERPLWPLGAAGVLLQVGAEVWTGRQLGGLALDTLGWTLALIGLLVASAGTWAGRLPRMEALSRLLFALASGHLALALLAPGGENALEEQSLWTLLHVGLILMGLAGLTTSFSISLLYLFVERRLKTRQLQGIARLPSLESLDRYNARAMAAGFVALSVGVAAGLLSMHVRRALALDLTVVGTLCLWAWYGAGLYLRLVLGWRGRLIAIIGAWGMAGLAALMALATLWLGGWHGGMA